MDLPYSKVLFIREMGGIGHNDSGTIHNLLERYLYIRFLATVVKCFESVPAMKSDGATMVPG
jgi:hypothetical protein